MPLRLSVRKKGLFFENHQDITHSKEKENILINSLHCKYCLFNYLPGSSSFLKQARKETGGIDPFSWSAVYASSICMAPTVLYMAVELSTRRRAKEASLSK
jgi:hypothetical protein